MTATDAETHFRALAPRLRAYLRVLAGSEADDLLQEVFLAFLRLRRAIEPARIESWLFLKARSLALNRRRDEARREAREMKRRMESPETSKSGPEEEAARREDLDRLSGCLDRLSRPVAEMLWLKVTENWSLARIAEATGIPRSTVAVRVQEGLVQVHRCFQGEGS